MPFNVTATQINRKFRQIDFADPLHRVYECPVCQNGKVKVEKSVFYGRCDQCGATLIDFVPLQHQEDYFLSTTTYKLLIGGYGSGKTTIACFTDAHDAMTIPNGKTLITAPTLQQMRVAVLPELEKFLPPWFLEGGKAKGNPPVYTLTNGHEIHVYPSDNEQKIRSINLTRFHIEEGSGVPRNIFDQLQARLRNAAAVVYDEHGYEIGNKFSGDVSTNPEDSWIKDDFLLKSHKLNGSRSIDTSIYEHMMSNIREPLFETFISASFDNSVLPKGTIERISAGKSERWKRKYLWCYLDSKEGLVYPEIYKHYVEPFPIPKEWKRIGGYDPGISDPTAMLLGAVDPVHDIIYFYDEYYVRDQTISYHGDYLKPKITPYSWLRPISSDPSVNKRSQETGISYKAYFKQVTGITLNPVNNDLLFGIDKVRDYIYQGKVKFFNNLENFKREASLYAFPSSDIRDKNVNNKPIDKDNHLMDCLRYAIVPMPNNPSDFRQAYFQTELLDKKTYLGITNRKQDNPQNNTKDYNKVVYGFRRTE
jgi:hypothetical protein